MPKAIAAGVEKHHGREQAMAVQKTSSDADAHPLVRAGFSESQEIPGEISEALAEGGTSLFAVLYKGL